MLSGLRFKEGTRTHDFSKGMAAVFLRILDFFAIFPRLQLPKRLGYGIRLKHSHLGDNFIVFTSLEVGRPFYLVFY